MSLWFLCNTGLALLAFLFISLNRDAPHRLRFHVTALALCSWLLPWQLLSPFIASLTPLLPGRVLPATNLTAPFNSIAAASVEQFDWLQPLLNVLPVLLLVSGLALFLLTAVSYALLLARLQRQATAAAWLQEKLARAIGAAGQEQSLPPINIQHEVPGAISTGLFRPVIWVHASLLEDPALEAVLLHEWTHIRQHDSAWLLLITLVEKVLWWNPLVQLLGRQARRLQELSCDEACAISSPQYRPMLNQLVLRLSLAATPQLYAKHALCSGMFKDANFNVERIRLLKRSYSMKKKHYLGTAVLFASAFLVVSFAAAQSGAGQTDRTSNPALEEYKARVASDPQYDGWRERMQQRANGEAVEMTEQDIRIGLEMYASNLEMAYKELKEKNAALERTVLELEQSMNVRQQN